MLRAEAGSLTRATEDLRAMQSAHFGSRMCGPSPGTVCEEACRELPRELTCIAMEQFLDFVIRALIEFPEEMVIVRSEEGRKINFRVKLRRSDVGRVIGRNGHVVDALRALLNAAAARHGQRAHLDVIE